MKAQASFEYLMVAALIALIILPATYAFFKYSQSSGEDIKENQIVKFGRDTVNTAELIYYQGYPSRITLEQTLPDGVENISILRDWDADPRINELFIAGRFGEHANEFAFPSNVNLLGFFDAFATTQGLKKLRLQASSTPNRFPFVVVAIGGTCSISQTYDTDDDKDIDIFDFTYCDNCRLGGGAEGCNSVCDYDGDCEINEQDMNILDALQGR